MFSFSVGSEEKHRQNRSKPLTQAPATNGELAQATNPAPWPYQNADICGSFRANHAKSGQAMPRPIGRRELSPLHPNGERQPAKNRPKENPAKPGQIRSKAAKSGHAEGNRVRAKAPG
jgi:hypothetical protein